MTEMVACLNQNPSKVNEYDKEIPQSHTFPWAAFFYQTVLNKYLITEINVIIRPRRENTCLQGLQKGEIQPACSATETSLKFEFYARSLSRYNNF